MARNVVKQHAGVLLELVNHITLNPSDNPQARKYEDRKCAQFAVDARRILPKISYTMYLEISAILDQNGSTFEAYVSRQIGTLYFLLRLSALLKDSPSDTDRRIDIRKDVGDDVVTRSDVFPDGVLEGTPETTAYRLLSNYLVEQWNWYIDNGPVTSERQATALQRLYPLMREVVQVYGWWAWPFFHHYDSSEHVDQMLKLVEESNGRFPLTPR